MCGCVWVCVCVECGGGVCVWFIFSSTKYHNYNMILYRSKGRARGKLSGTCKNVGCILVCYIVVYK